MGSIDLPLGKLFPDGVRVAVNGDPLPGADAAHGAESGDDVDERHGAQRRGHGLDGAVAIGIGATTLRKIKAKITCDSR